MKVIKLKPAAVLAAAALLITGITGCSTQAQQSCSLGRALPARSLADTCAQAQADYARHVSELATGAAVALVGLDVAAVIVSGNNYQGNRSYQTVVVNNSARAAAPAQAAPVVAAGESQQDVLTPRWGFWK